jgi:hypothetical protein
MIKPLKESKVVVEEMVYRLEIFVIVRMSILDSIEQRD